MTASWRRDRKAWVPILPLFATLSTRSLPTSYGVRCSREQDENNIRRVPQDGYGRNSGKGESEQPWKWKGFRPVVPRRM